MLSVTKTHTPAPQRPQAPNRRHWTAARPGHRAGWVVARAAAFNPREPTKFCRDCIYFVRPPVKDDAGEPPPAVGSEAERDFLRKGKCSYHRVVDPVSGRAEFVSATVQRSGLGGCGIEGLFYEERVGEEDRGDLGQEAQGER